MEYSKFAQNREVFGECSSWAIWDMGAGDSFRFLPDPAEAPKYFLNKSIQKLNRIASQTDLDSIGRDLRTDLILVALNFAERPENQKLAMQRFKYASFHEETTTTSDHRLRDACCGTPLWGSYITDLVKFQGEELQPLRDSSSANVKKILRDEDFMMQQIRGLIAELSQLGCVNPILTAMGNVVFDAFKKPRVIKELKDHLGSDIKIIKVTHYSKAAGIRHSDYVAKVYGELRSYGIM